MLKALFKSLLNRYKDVVLAYVLGQWRDVETRLSAKWLTPGGFPTSVKTAFADIREALTYVLTHGGSGVSK